MATLEKNIDTKHNYVVEDFNNYAIVKRRKTNSDFELKVIQFDESIIEKLAQLKETDKEKHDRLLKFYQKIKKLINDLKQ